MVVVTESWATIMAGGLLTLVVLNVGILVCLLVLVARK